MSTANSPVLTKEDIEHYKDDYEAGLVILQKITKRVKCSEIEPQKNEGLSWLSRLEWCFWIPYTDVAFTLDPVNHDSWLGIRKDRAIRALRCLHIYVRHPTGRFWCDEETILPGSIKTRLKALLKREH